MEHSTCYSSLAHRSWYVDRSSSAADSHTCSLFAVQGITFCAITIRIALYQSDMSRGSRDRPSQGATSVDGPIPTIGSIPMRPLPISINITKEIEAHADSHSGSPTPGDIADGVYNMDGKPRSSNSGDESFMHVA